MVSGRPGPLHPPKSQSQSIQKDALNRWESLGQFLDCLSTFEKDELLTSLKKAQPKGDLEKDSDSESQSQGDNAFGRLMERRGNLVVWGGL